MSSVDIIPPAGLALEFLHFRHISPEDLLSWLQKPNVAVPLIFYWTVGKFKRPIGPLLGMYRKIDELLGEQQSKGLSQVSLFMTKKGWSDDLRTELSICFPAIRDIVIFIDLHV